MSLKEKRNNLRNEFVSQNKLFLDNIATMVVSLDYNYIVQWSNADSFFENNKYYKYGTKCYKSFGLSSPCKNCPVKEVIETNKEIKIKFDKIPGKLFSVTAIPIAGDKNTARVVLKLDDITEKEKLIKELQSSNELMDLVIDQTPSAMFIKDIDNGFRYVLASDYFCNIIANTPKENVIGHTDFDIFQDKNAAE